VEGSSPNEVNDFSLIYLILQANELFFINLPNPEGNMRLSVHPNKTNFKSTGTTRNKAIAKELANGSACQIQYVLVVILKLVFSL
jgi:hypothetical protein